MRNSKVLRGVCYVLIPILVFLVAFSFVYEFYREDISEREIYYMVTENNETVIYYSEYGRELSETISENEKEFLEFMDDISFMNFVRTSSYSDLYSISLNNSSVFNYFNRTF